MAARQMLVAGNWKMHLTVGEAIQLATALKRELYHVNNIGIAVSPPFTALDEVAEVIHESNLALGAQDMHWEDQGAYTGVVSLVMLKDLGCQYVIVAHSERRQYFGETNQTANKKLKAAIKHGLIPIYCVGETLKEREENQTSPIVQRQLEEGLEGILEPQLASLVIAYEPVWAIGTGRNATPEQAQEVQHFIRGQLAQWTNETIAQAVRILYGGSIKPDNIRELIAEEDVDGALVGGSSIKADEFVQIVKICASLSRKAA